MKFNLTEEQSAELDGLVAQLRKWIGELEALDLERYDPILDPSPRSRSSGDVTADD
jgi:hypothetical protein